MDYLFIKGCFDCTQIAWCGLQLQSISGKSPYYGYSLYLSSTPGISDMCGAKNLKGALTGGLRLRVYSPLRPSRGLGSAHFAPSLVVARQRARVARPLSPPPCSARRDLGQSPDTTHSVRR
jgi:hypothetical protein